MVLGVVMVPVAVCWLLTAPVLRLAQKTPQEVADASYYAMVLAVCLPVRIGTSTAWKWHGSGLLERLLAAHLLLPVAEDHAALGAWRLSMS